MRRVLAAVFCLWVPASASAGGFLTRDLGDGGHYRDCVARAVQAMQIYADRAGARQGDVSQTDWAAYAFGLMPGSVDVQIACPYRDNISLIVLLTTYSTGAERDRQRVLDGIADIWDALEDGGLPPAGGTKRAAR